MAFKQLDLLLGKVQEDSDREETGLDATDFRQVAEGFSLGLTQGMTPLNFAVGRFDQQANVPGDLYADAKVTTYLTADGETGADSFADYLTSSGLKLSQSGGSTRKSYFPSSDYLDDWTRMTLWKYTGEKFPLGSYLTKAFGFMFNGIIKGEIGKPVSLELTGKGAVSAVPDVANYPSDPITQLAHTIPPALNGASFVILGDSAGTYRLLSFEIDFGNKLELVKDMTRPFGFARCDITDVKAKWKAKIYEGPYAHGSGGVNPFSMASTPRTFDFGISLFSGNAIRIATGFGQSSRAQLTAPPKSGNENGINTWDLEGIILNNDWCLTINAGASA